MKKFVSRRFAKYSPDWLRELRWHLAGKDAEKSMSQRAAAARIRTSGASWAQWETSVNTPDNCHQLLLDLLADGTL